MGLSIHYQLSVARKLPEEQVRGLLERVAGRARVLGCAQVSPMHRAFSEPVFAGLFVRAGRPQDGRFCHGNRRAKDIPRRGGFDQFGVGRKQIGGVRRDKQDRARVQELRHDGLT